MLPAKYVGRKLAGYSQRKPAGAEFPWGSCHFLNRHPLKSTTYENSQSASFSVTVLHIKNSGLVSFGHRYFSGIVLSFFPFFFTCTAEVKLTRKTFLEMYFVSLNEGEIIGKACEHRFAYFLAVSATGEEVPSKVNNTIVYVSLATAAGLVVLCFITGFWCYRKSHQKQMKRFILLADYYVSC